MNPNGSFRHRPRRVPPVPWAIVVLIVLVLVLAIADTVEAVRRGIL